MIKSIFRFSSNSLGMAKNKYEDNVRSKEAINSIGLFIDQVVKSIVEMIKSAFKFITRKLGIVKTQDGDGKVRQKKAMDDVGGMYEAKEEFREVLSYFHNPKKFKNIGATCPRGLILSGPPGVGKTMLVRALAEESAYNFIYCGPDQFSASFVGEGSRRVRDLFKRVRSKTPCILFIDELESVGGRRAPHLGVGESDTILNTLLTEIDGFAKDVDNVFIVGATNMISQLDPALTRAGRLEKTIHISLPVLKEREDIARVILSNFQYNPESINVRDVAIMTQGMPGSSIYQVINQAALLCVRDNQKTIEQKQFIEALHMITLGGKVKRYLKISDSDKEKTAYHEAGHALLAYLCEDHDKPHVISTLPRGNSLGVTVLKRDEEEDYLSMSYSNALSSVVVLFGGFAAESIKYSDKNVTSGAVDDLSKATNLANHIVRSYGWRKDYGFLVLPHSNREGYLHSENMLAKADTSAQKLLQESYEKAKSTILKYVDKFELLANLLIENRTLYKEDIDRFFAENNLVQNSILNKVDER